MYDELVKRLRNCAYEAAPCNSCASDGDPDCVDKMMHEAADAIEQLSADLERSKEWEGFWKEQAEEARGKLQQYALAVANNPRWIPVTERLPEEHVFVLIRQDDDRMMVAVRVDGDWWYRYFAYDVDRWDENEQGTITHWMPLPEPPKEE